MFAVVLFATLVSSNAAVLDSALFADDPCLGGEEECSLELRQLRGEVKEGQEDDEEINVEEATALQDATAEEDDEEDEGTMEEDEAEDEEYEDDADADIENVADMKPGRRCFTPKDKKMFKAGAKHWATVMHKCNRECTFTKKCITTCMMKHGYSKGCSSCTGLVVRCAHDRCGHTCHGDFEKLTKQCRACNKKKCGKVMQDCSGRGYLMGKDSLHGK
eukprot:TRINITY_DN7719_c0_g1_i3.p2 TRINITY_DN7719_c0_g1~~TRINITY_DN7719_c0_g1_i3.p2  ORF type:complete len:236 (+),score=69.83 TRINITY_DN7719_c0_g1_i3:55-708(+)